MQSRVRTHTYTYNETLTPPLPIQKPTTPHHQEMTVSKGDSCVLCGCEKLWFEPPAYYCNGVGCNSSRIRRNSYFYRGGRNQYHWSVKTNLIRLCPPSRF
jgi:hypothetical protein